MTERLRRLAQAGDADAIEALARKDLRQGTVAVRRRETFAPLEQRGDGDGHDDGDGNGDAYGYGDSDGDGHGENDGFYHSYVAYNGCGNGCAGIRGDGDGHGDGDG